MSRRGRGVFAASMRVSRRMRCACRSATSSGESMRFMRAAVSASRIRLCRPRWRRQAGRGQSERTWRSIEAAARLCRAMLCSALARTAFTVAPAASRRLPARPRRMRFEAVPAVTARAPPAAAAATWSRQRARAASRRCCCSSASDKLFVSSTPAATAPEPSAVAARAIGTRRLGRRRRNRAAAFRPVVRASRPWCQSAAPRAVARSIRSWATPSRP